MNQTEQMLRDALQALLDVQNGPPLRKTKDEWESAMKAGYEALSAPAVAVNLESIEQYRLQMAAIGTAALGYWKEGDSIHSDYDTVPLRDVAKLYAKYQSAVAVNERLIEALKLIESAQLSDHSHEYVKGVAKAAIAAYEAAKKGGV